MTQTGRTRDRRHPLLPAAVQVRRSRTMVAVVLAVAFGLFAGGLWISSDDTPPYRGGPVSIATGVPSGVYYRYGTLLAPRLASDLGVGVTVEDSSGSLDNLERIRTGQATVGLATADAVASLPEEQRDQLRAIARLYDDYVQLVVPTGSPIKTVADLRGKRVGIGPRGSGVELIARRVLATAQIDPDRDLVPERAGIGDAADMLATGKVDAFFWSGGLPTDAVRSLAQRMDLRFVDLGDVAKTLRDQYQQVYREAVIPADAYKGVAKVTTVAVPNLLVTRADADPGLIRRVTGTVMGGREAIGAEVHAAQLVDPRTAVFTYPPLMLHEGARLWYRSAKP